ncbi:MAG: TIGR03032 family protein [Pirellulales bacterium]|nr:TIGR03032 family protein [Pirellulales bacterium]
MSSEREHASEPLEAKLREVRYRHSLSFVDVLREIGATLLVSTYQAGKLGAVTAGDKGLQFSFLNFDQAMGVAVSPRRLAVGAKGQVWFFESNPQIAPTLAPAGRYDACYLARSAHVTGGIHCHEMAWGAAGELWVVNTLFSCLATLHDEYSFVPRWRPPFIRELAGEDRCHLNGLAMDAGRPRFVTVMAESNEPAGWRPTKSTSGCVLDVASGSAVSRGLAMPHSPRWHNNQLWVLHSGCGSLEVVDPATGRRDTVATMPGYTRGLAFAWPLAFVGLSRIRETAVFGGVPIAERREELKCGVGVVNLQTGQTIATLEFETGVEEIFDVQLIPNARAAFLCGPRPDQDDSQDIWIVPRPDQTELLADRPTREAPHPQHAAPTDSTVQSWVQQALALQRERRMPEALRLLQQAASARPLAAEIWNHLGNALQEAGRQENALEHYRRAAIADPHFGPALQNLGYVLVAQGDTDEGISFLRQAQKVQPTDVNHVLIATALPVVYDSVEDLHARRQRLVSQVKQLADDGLAIDTTNTLVPTNFFAAYQGENDRDLHANLGRIYRGVDLCQGRRIGHASSRLRIGFLSAYFRDHTIGRLNLGRVRHLPRGLFEVVVLSVGQHEDEMAQAFRAAADRHVVVPREVAKARQLVADQKLDVLLFTDVGMDALTYTLAFSRMAPVQCATWGHPVTTGSPTIDYFLSSDLLEIPEADTHYTETLARLPSLGTYYDQPRLTEPTKKRSDFSLAADRPLYLCPQTLFKFHPEFDGVLADILRRDPRGQLVLIEGRTANWTRLIKTRLARVMPDVADRIHWLAPLPNPDYVQLLALADVVLDPIHFGGGNSSYEALAMGTPVITWPGKFLRSRITQALYAKMGMIDFPGNPRHGSSFIVDSADDYAEKAVRLATTAADRQQCRQEIASRSGCLFQDVYEIGHLTDMILLLCKSHEALSHNPSLF